MFIVEDAKRLFEHATGIGRYTPAQLTKHVRAVKPRALRFADDGATPNNPVLPLLIYPRALSLSGAGDPAALIEDLFAHHGWRRSWRDGIYDFVHFHTRTHEVLGVARGTARIRFGGERGKIVAVKAGDVIVVPAGTGHQRVAQSDDLLVVGAYPAGGRYDEPRPDEVDHARAKAAIAKVRAPARDPIYGRNGPVFELWGSGAPRSRRR